MLKLEGRTCYFAGATGNIGRGAVRDLASQGMNVIMATHNPASAEEIIAECAHFPGKVIALSDQKPLAEALEEYEHAFGSIDVYISTTGTLSVTKPFEELSAEDLDRKLHHHITSPFQTLQVILPFLKRSAHPRVILCSSAGALNGMKEENILDSIARGGMLSMTACLAREFLPYGITVNCIARSGMVNDHDNHSDTTLEATDILPSLPVRRLGTPEEFGALVSWLASEQSAFVTGQIFSLDGGLNIGR